MPYFEISEDELNALPDEVKTKFKSYTPEDVTGLKSKANDLLGEKKALDAALAEAKAESAKLAADLKSGKIAPDQGKLEDAMKQLVERDSTIAALQKSISDGKINAQAEKIAAQLATKDARKQALLAQQVKSRLQLDGENITVLSKDGKPTISDIDELTAEFKTEYDFLVDGNMASGGGASGGSGRADPKPTNQINRRQFDEMTHPERAKFAQEGGKVIDD